MSIARAQTHKQQKISIFMQNVQLSQERNLFSALQTGRIDDRLFIIPAPASRFQSMAPPPTVVAC